MTQRLSLISIIIDDYDAALDYYVGVLGFNLVADTNLTKTKRWVVVVPPGGSTGLLLAKAVNEEQREIIGRQGAGRVFLFLETDDFDRDFRHYADKGVRFVERPRDEIYGMVVVFEDPYGNRWDLIEPRTSNDPTCCCLLKA